jgi:hypothetical protein
VTLGAVGVLYGFLCLVGRFGSMPDLPVLPTHYSSLLQTDDSKRPGYCTECGTQNGAGYEVCRNCAATIETTDDPPEWDGERVFEF